MIPAARQVRSTDGLSHGTRGNQHKFRQRHRFGSPGCERSSAFCTRYLNPPCTAVVRYRGEPSVFLHGWAGHERKSKCSLPGSNWRSSDCSWNTRLTRNMRPTLYRLSQGSISVYGCRNWFITFVEFTRPQASIGDGTKRKSREQ